MTEEKQEPITLYRFHGITSGTVNNIFDRAAYCDNDRFWRRSIGQLNDKYFPHQAVDECRNAYVKPKPPVEYDLIKNLHRLDDNGEVVYPTV